VISARQLKIDQFPGEPWLWAREEASVERGGLGEIRRLRRSERLSISEIARVVGISRNTVKAALASDGPPKYQRAAAGSVADVAEPRIRELLAAYPRMPATVIAERIGWSYSIRTLSVRSA
jgi:transposase